MRKRSFEVVISSEDFVVSSYYHGKGVCKLNINSLWVLAYQTPVKVFPSIFNYRNLQYDLNNTELEQKLSGIDAQEILGSTLEIDREDWPDCRNDPLADLLTGTHCIRERRDGNKCCSKQIWEMINNVVDETQTSPAFNESCETPGVIANVSRPAAYTPYFSPF